MGGMRIDPRELPLPMREQLGAKIVAELAKATSVAGRRKALKVSVKRLRFPNRRSAERYEVLKDALRLGLISNMHLLFGDGYVRAFTFIIEWGGDYIPDGIGVKDLEYWRLLGPGYMVVEDVE